MYRLASILHEICTYYMKRAKLISTNLKMMAYCELMKATLNILISTFYLSWQCLQVTAHLMACAISECNASRTNIVHKFKFKG